MARERMVTRLMHTTRSNVMIVNITNGETSTMTVSLSTTFKDENKLFKAVAKVVSANPVLKAVHIISSEQVEALYGMPEQDFMTHAVRLDPTTRKAIATEEATED